MNAITLKFERQSSAVLRARRASYHVLRHQSGKGFVAHEDLPAITLDRGQLTVGSVPIHTARFTADRITWIQQSPGRYTSGLIYFHDGGLSIHGVVNLGTTRSDAVRHNIVGTAIKPITYKTKITKAPYPSTQDPSTIADSDWQDGLDLEISYQVKVGAAVPKPVVKLDGQDISSSTTWSISSNDDTVLRLVLTSGACFGRGAGFYKTGGLSFNPRAAVPMGHGTVSATCHGTQPPSGNVYFWKTVSVSAGLRAQPMAVERISAADLIAVQGELSVDELMTILPDDAVAKDAQEMLMRNMKWAMGQSEKEKEWLSRFFGQTPPTLDPSNQADKRQIDLINQSVSWYQDSFAKAYLTQGFQNYSGPNAPKEHRLNTAQASKLNEWFKTGLAHEKDFTVQHAGIFAESFRRVHTELNPYLQDADKWAKALFDVLIALAQLILMVNRIYGAQGDPKAFGPLNANCTLLTVLEPSAKLATAYHKAVIVGLMNTMAPDSSHRDKATVLEWLPKVLETMLRKFADGDIPEGADLTKQQAQEMLEAFLKNPSEIATGMAELLTAAIESDLFTQIEKAEENFASFAQRWPKLIKFAKSLFVVGWIGSVVSILMTLIQGRWKDMTDIQKAQFVTDIAATVLQAVKPLASLWQGVKNIPPADYEKFIESVNEPVQTTEIVGTTEEALGDADLIEVASTEMSVLVKVEGAEAGAFGRIFAEGIVLGIVKILGALTAVAMAAYSLWQLIVDILHGASISTKVFDSLIFVCNYLSAICIVLALDSASTFFPIAGAVLAIVGAILAIIAIFVEKPENPVEVFMRDEGIPFVDSIKLPTSSAGLLAITAVVVP
jgi:hypothetical protein